MVNPYRGSGPVPLEVILAWSWLIGIVAFVVLIGRLLQTRLSESASHEPCSVQIRRVPNSLELFHQRRRQAHPLVKRLSRLS